MSHKSSQISWRPVRSQLNADFRNTPHYNLRLAFKRLAWLVLKRKTEIILVLQAAWDLTYAKRCEKARDGSYVMFSSRSELHRHDVLG